MHSHLDIKVNGKSLVIPDDSSLSVEEKNPMFNDVTFFSYPMQIPVEGNREVLKNIAHRDSDMRAMDLEHADARIFADGLPLNHGQVITQDGSEIKDTFEFNIDAQQQSFSELIGDLECQDVRVKDYLVIGEKIGVVNYDYNYYVEESMWDSETGKTTIIASKSGDGSVIMDAPQALGFSIPARAQGFPLAEKATDGKSERHGDVEFYEPKITESFINVWKPYPFPYCNSRVAYAHPDVKRNDDGTYETDGIVKGNNRGSRSEDYGQYWCLDAFRQQSGICFYVLYFLDCLFEQLGVTFDNAELLEIEDLARLCFVTTKCEYDSVETDMELHNLQEISDWLRSRNCGGQIAFTIEVGRPRQHYSDNSRFYGNDLPTSYTTDSQGHINIEQLCEEDATYIDEDGDWIYQKNFTRKMNATFQVTGCKINEMYANSKNFPNTSVSKVISSLEASFGIRFLYDPEKRHVTARLLRNIFSNRKMMNFKGKVLSMTPVNEKITGFRMKFSAESDSREQRINVRNGVKDYDTEYDYIEYPEGRTVLNLNYVQIARLVSPTNMNVYVDKATGNTYRVKINSEAENSMTLRPTLFQVAQNKGIEEGDCSEKNKDYVREMVSDFIPLQVNVINAQDYNNDETGNVAPILAPFLDVKMEHEFLEKDIASVAFYDAMTQMSAIKTWGNHRERGSAFPDGMQMLATMRMWLSENYDPTQTDNGNSPLQDIDWGLTIGVMRGPGTGYGYAEEETGSGESSETETIEISESNFTSALADFLSIYYYGIRTTQVYDKTIAEVRATLSGLEENPEYGANYMIIESIGYTIHQFKESIDALIRLDINPLMTLRYSVLVNIYNLVVNHQENILFYRINNKMISKNELCWEVDRRFARDVTDGKYSTVQYDQPKFKEMLNVKTGDGSWPANEVVIAKCDLTYGQLRDYFNQMNNVKAYNGRVFNSVLLWYNQLDGLIGTTSPAGSGGGGSTSVTGSQIINYDKNYDGFGNDKWRQTIGAYVLTSDCMDLKGMTYDYNSDDMGVGVCERFSLQTRSFAAFVYYVDANGKTHINKDMSLAGKPVDGDNGYTWLIPCNDDERDEQGNIEIKVRSRGLYETFQRPHAHFLLHRKPYKVEVLATVAQLLDIRNHWEDKYVLDGKVGWINAIKYNIEKATGVGEAELEFYSL